MARIDTLANFLTDVAEAIRTKEGTTEAIPASEFDTRIANLSGGGSNEPGVNEITSVQELNNVMIESMTQLFDYYDNITGHGSDTNEPVTLYTPAEGFNYYLIRYRNNQFQAVWFDGMFIKERTSQLVQELNTQYLFSITGTGSMRAREDIPETVVSGFGIAYYNAYLSPSFDTVEEVISALKSSETIYTSASDSDWSVQYHSGENYDPYNSTPYTNMYFMDYTYKFISKKRISSNETIVVIPPTE